MRLLAVSRRSMEAIRRPNRVVEGTRPIDAVLDISVPFSCCGTIPLRDLRSIYVYQMPETTGLFAWQQLTVCIAANQEMAFQAGYPRCKRAVGTRQPVYSGYKPAFRPPT